MRKKIEACHLMNSDTKVTLQIIQVEASTSDHHDETVEKLYEELEKAFEKKSSRHHNLAGDSMPKLEYEVQKGSWLLQ